MPGIIDITGRDYTNTVHRTSDRDIGSLCRARHPMYSLTFSIRLYNVALINADTTSWRFISVIYPLWEKFSADDI